MTSHVSRDVAPVATSQPGTFEWLTAEEAACHLKVKARTLLLWVRHGKIRAFALSGTKRRVWRFLKSDLDGALLGNPVLHYATGVRAPHERETNQ